MGISDWIVDRALTHLGAWGSPTGRTVWSGERRRMVRSIGLVHIGDGGSHTAMVTACGKRIRHVSGSPTTMVVASWESWERREKWFRDGAYMPELDMRCRTCIRVAKQQDWAGGGDVVQRGSLAGWAAQ